MHFKDESVVGNEHPGSGTDEIDPQHTANFEGSETNTSTYHFRLSACTKMTCLQLTMRKLETWKRRWKREHGPHLFYTTFRIRWHYSGPMLDLS